MTESSLQAEPLNRAKYLEILKQNGLSAALTALHRDAESLEFQTFEGPGGFKPEFYSRLEEYRSFSRELWRVSLGQIPDSNPRE